MDAREKTARLAYLKGRMEIARMHADYWITRARITGSGKHLRTAKDHIDNYQDLLDAQDTILRDKETT